MKESIHETLPCRADVKQVGLQSYRQEYKTCGGLLSLLNTFSLVNIYLIELKTAGIDRNSIFFISETTQARVDAHAYTTNEQPHKDEHTPLTGKEKNVIIIIILTK